VNRLARFGLATMIVTESATLAGIEPFATWNTPIAWTGFILFADGVVSNARGTSWIRSAPREFVFLAIASIPLWLVFEFYNLYVANWYYTGLSENRALRLFGFAWAFATIWPAIFEGAELIAVWRGSRTAPRATALTRTPPGSPGLAALSIVCGAVLLLWPLLWPSPLLAAPVFLGFIFLLDPLNERLGAESLSADLRSGNHDRLWNLLLSGFLCGFLWEFWNYWARGKWHYAVPIMENFKIFEMTVPGYFGFPPFAVECFTMYVFARALAARVMAPSGRAASRTANPGRTIAL
jgi:hypothetical protein